MIKKLLFLFLLPVCFSCTKQSVSPGQKPIVLVTVAPYAYFVRQIANDLVDIQTLIPPNVNMHIFEPTPNLVEKSAQAAVWFRIDEPFEKKIVTAFKERNHKQIIINLQEGIHLLHGDEIELSPCQENHHHSHGGSDLHTWLSIKNVLIQTKVIAETLSALFPEHKEIFVKNLKQLTGDLQNLDRDIKELLHPFKGQAILVSHPALGYFCRDYNLLQLSVECEGKDPRPRDVEEILNKAQTYQVRCVFLQQGYNNQGAQLIGKKLNLPVYQIEPYGEDYLNNMRQIAGLIGK